MDVLALVGDVHGEQHRMVSMLLAMEQRHGVKIKAVLQVGDFEAHRDAADLQTMAAPQRYRKLGDFHAYYGGSARFPWPVYFVGGNHESYGWLDQHPAGAELTANCRYLGRVGSIEIGDIRVVGLSGIFNPAKFEYERPPVSQISRKPNKDYTYYNEDDIEQALDYAHSDILLVHDWPDGIINPQDAALWREAEMPGTPHTIGNEYTEMLVHALIPKIVACGHMHCRYRNTLTVGSRTVEICCLANVDRGVSSVVLLDEALRVIV